MIGFNVGGLYVDTRGCDQRMGDCLLSSCIYSLYIQFGSLL